MRRKLLAVEKSPQKVIEVNNARAVWIEISVRAAAAGTSDNLRLYK
jgi:hypothetical protein